MATKVIRVKRFKVRVYPECADKPQTYTVYAVDPLDACIMAFALDGGFPKAMMEMDEGHVELVKMYTEIV